MNPSHEFFDILLDLECPFLKREVVAKNVIKHPFLFDRLKELSSKLETTNRNMFRRALQQFGGTRSIYI